MSTSASAGGGLGDSVSGIAQSAQRSMSPSRAQLETSQNAIKETTKWLVAAAGAVAVVVVAGLQLSHLPTGFWASFAAISGFVIALLGVAIVIFSAAGVLSAGYTTFGELADLNKTEKKRIQLEKPWYENKLRLERKRAGQGSLKKAITGLQIFIIDRFHDWRLRLFEQEILEVESMVRYLETDILILSNYLAGDIAELQSRIQAADREILRIRGEKPSHKVQPKTSGVSSTEPRPDAAAASGTTAATKLEDEISGGSAGLHISELGKAEWREDQLETAAGQLIAFANQRVIEQRFRKLKRSVQYGGLAVLFGVSLFALAPKGAEPTPLTVAAPTRVILIVKSPRNFGPNCTSTELSGIAIGGTWDEPIVTTGPSKDCNATRLDLKPNIGFAIPVVA